MRVSPIPEEGPRSKCEGPALLGDDVLNADLCEVCRGMFARDGIYQLLSRTGFRHHTDTSLRANSMDGCRFCSFFLRLADRLETLGVTVFHNPGGSVTFSLERDEPHTTSVDAVSFQQLVGYQLPLEKRAIRKDLSFIISAREDSPCAAFVPKRPVHSDFRSEKVLSTAKAMLSECKDSHFECVRRSGKRLPTRVIDVGDGSNQCLENVKLHVSAAQEHGEYVTLSYCWGGDQPVRLEQKTLKEFTRGIKVNGLPKTLRDAIITTRSLGFRYLWIDALCIIQDNDRDKMKEIRTMGEIYRNSELTISASNARSVNGGLSSRYDESRIEAMSVDISLAGGQRGSITISVPAPNNFGSLPINKRGWTFQEYILSRRLLAFGDEVAWACSRESYRSLIPSPIDPSGYLPPKGFNALARIASEEDRARAWEYLVQKFCLRETFLAEDRIHAISGVVSMLEPEWEDKCFFGLWRSRLLSDMGWVVSPTSGMKRSSRAPSWSWMCLDHKTVHTGYRVGAPDAKLLYAEIGCRRLRLEARLISVPLEQRLAAMQPGTDIISGIMMDLDSSEAQEETAGKELSFLYLGEEVGTRCSIGLVTAFTKGSDVIQRVGFFEVSHLEFKEPRRQVFLE